MSRLLLSAALSVFLFTGHALALPPTRPMIIHGEVLVDGAGVPADTAIELQVGQTVVTVQTTLTGTGLSYYNMVIPSAAVSANPVAGETIQFRTVGGQNLMESETPSIVYEPGKSVKKNIIKNQALALAPGIVSASVDSGTAGLALNAEVSPITFDAGTVSYKVKWYARDPNATDPALATKLIHEGRLSGGAPVEAPVLRQLSVWNSEHIWATNNDNEIYRWTGFEWGNIPGHTNWVSVGAGGTSETGPIFKQVSVGSADNIWGTDNNNKIYRWTGADWENIPGDTNWVSVASDGTVVGTQDWADGLIWKYDTSVSGGWRQMPGKAKQVTVQNALVWQAIAMDGSFIYTHDGATTWPVMPGGGINISRAADGDLWCTNSEHKVYRWNGPAGRWDEPQAAARLKQISVGSADNVWGISPAGNPYQWTDSGWIANGPSMKNIAAGADGTVWAVNPCGKVLKYDGANFVAVQTAPPPISPSTTATVGGTQDFAGGIMWRYDPSVSGGWRQVHNALMNRVSVSSKNVWVGLNSVGTVYYSTGVGGYWYPFAGVTAIDVSIAQDGTLWSVATGNKVYRWNYLTSAWDEPQAAARLKQISVGSVDNIWGISPAGNPYQWTDSGWIANGPGMINIAAGTDGTVWALDTDGKVLKYDGAKFVAHQPASGTSSTATVADPGNYRYLELVITPVLSDGKIGPSAHRKIIPVASSGAL